MKLWYAFMPTQRWECCNLLGWHHNILVKPLHETLCVILFFYEVIETGVKVWGN